jgi:hypothetical protein
MVKAYNYIMNNPDLLNQVGPGFAQSFPIYAGGGDPKNFEKQADAYAVERQKASDKASAIIGDDKFIAEHPAEASVAAQSKINELTPIINGVKQVLANPNASTEAKERAQQQLDAAQNQFNAATNAQKKAKETIDAVRQDKVDTALGIETAKANRGVLGSTDKTGDDYLSTLPTSERALIENVVSGRSTLSPRQLQDPKSQKLLAEIEQAYPGVYDTSKAKQYDAVRKDYESGKTSVALNSGATALKHLSELQDLNTIGSRVYGSSSYNAYNNKLNTVVGELIKFYGMPDTNESVSAMKSGLGATFNRDAAIVEQAKSMGDKFASLQQTWDNASPSERYKPPMPQVDNEAKIALQKLHPAFVQNHPEFAPRGAQTPSVTPSASAAKTTDLIIPQDLRGKATALQQFQSPDGKSTQWLWTGANGKPVRAATANEIPKE